MKPRPPVRHQRLALALGLGLAVALVASPAPAQLVGGGLPALPGGGLPGGGLPGSLPDVPRVGRDLPSLADRTLAPALQTATSTLTAVRRLAAERLLRDHRDLVEPDDHGQPVVRGEVLAIGVDVAAAARLGQAGYTVRRTSDLADLGLQAVVLGLPAGKSAVAAVRELRALDPAGQFEFNHLYIESGAVGGSAIAVVAAGDASGFTVGLVDGSVAASRPALADARLTQRAFAPGGARTTAHATAVASLIVGARGAAPGASLDVADVYGPTPAGGSAEAIARGLAWLAREKVPVISISLVGPPNLLLGAAVQALVARGHLVVAPVGNDGPAAAPLYPAAYPGVVAVTGVDARRRVLPEAGRGAHVDFAAPGADVSAAGLAGGFVTVRGTSFAAPVVAARLAKLLPAPDPAGARAAVDALGRAAVDLGAPGLDPIYGRGFVDAGRR
ncbi:S8 family serine peptidase [Phenylobacterium sp.]|uniref:S8 family serine peptidase n=1 Tax=Phenylobacterium sp. TaxID=1871053 RepID=UPI003563B8A3